MADVPIKVVCNHGAGSGVVGKKMLGRIFSITLFSVTVKPVQINNIVKCIGLTTSGRLIN